MLLSALVAFAPMTLYVVEGGSDANPGTARAPYATLARLQARLRELPADHPPVVVRLKGTLRLDTPLVLGTEANGVRFEGPAVVSGGVALRGWRETTFMGKTAWATSTDFNFHQLFVGDFRAPRPRLPKAGFASFAGYADPKDAEGEWTKGQSAMRFHPGDLRADWRNLSDVEVVAHHLWVTSRLPVLGIDGDVVRFSKTSVFRLKDDYATGMAPYVVENVAEAMAAPGEWYLDRPARTVYYLPRVGERRQGFVAVAPRLATLVRIEGARGTTFKDVAFRDAEWNLPANSAGDGQAAVGVPGAVQIASGENVALEGCRVEHVGTYGIEILGASKGCRVERCLLRDLGAGGVKVGDGPEANLIADNTIEGGGRVYASACGILVGLSGDNRIVHNRIRDLFYTGISVGWDWGFKDTAAKDNLIAFNDIADIGQGELSDMGGIYVLGKQPGSRIDHNRIRNVDARGYGGWGVYLDEGSTGWMVENNVVTDTKTGGFHIHYGGDNLIRNNVFAYARKEGQLIRQRDDKQGPIRFERNLVVARPGDAPLVVPNWLHRDVVLTGNLYAAAKTDLPFGDDGTGRFVSIQLGSDGLPPQGSEVYRMGFQPIDLKTVGPRRR